jgi:exopolysaccharide biosynthesis polyprenyl glycosylphosphotransferase
MQNRTVDRALFRWASVAADIASALAAAVAARAIRLTIRIPLTDSLLPTENFRLSARVLLLLVGVQLLALSIFGLYRAQVRLAGALWRLIASALAVQLISFTTILYFFPVVTVPRSILVLYLALDGVLLWSERRILRRLAVAGGRTRALVVGEPEQGRILAEAIARHPWTGIDLAGIAATRPPGGETSGTFLARSPEDLDRIIAETGSQHVLFAPEDTSFRDLAIEHLTRSGAASLWVLPSAYETLIGRLRFRPLGELPLLEVRAAAPHGLAGAAKRLLDIAAASAGLALGAPLLAVAAAAIRIASGPPAFYSQSRVGRGGRIFRLWKLRTMRTGAENETGAVLAARGDPRVTRVGRMLRAARIDEIPQLVNVLKGEMSLVGPRPERPEFVERFEREIPGYGLRLAVRPGLTGLAQVSGEYETHPRIKLRYDLAYINNWSPGLDLAILARTLPVVLGSRGV